MSNSAPRFVVNVDLKYVRSITFVIADDVPVVDVLFLGEYESGEPTITDTLEVADILWMTAEEVFQHSKTLPHSVDAMVLGVIRSV